LRAEVFLLIFVPPGPDRCPVTAAVIYIYFSILRKHQVKSRGSSLAIYFIITGMSEWKKVNAGLFKMYEVVQVGQPKLYILNGITHRLKF